MKKTSRLWKFTQRAATKTKIAFQNKLFYTEEFSQKRNAMTAAGFNTRKLYQEIIESQLVELPIARRSEMDEVYKLVYDLRKQVKILNAQVQELKKEQL